ncbi:MAG: dihydroxyacetone kinase phosphoryl donor subunit DhaM [Chloroflexota bacterium]|nr:dihydroxyacetone kinase phosphoryl donor subunit DhaM [Chloroflexota bacterium]
MVNLILVSHSKKLADGVTEMVKQMTASESVKILTAAGTGENNQDLGTNAIEIVEAIESAYTDDGILILMDLGSAVLSTEMALEMVSDEMKANISVCPAPFVEGAIAAAVQAGLGSDLSSVYKEAMQSLKMKTEQLSDMIDSQAEEQVNQEIVTGSDKNEREITLTVPNKQGLHARPAVLFVKTIGKFDAKVMVKNLTENKGPVEANSLISVMTIAARQGHQLQITAEGEEKDAVINALKDLFERNLEDEE